MIYTVKVNVFNEWLLRARTKDLKQANQQADKMREQGFEVKFIKGEKWNILKIGSLVYLIICVTYFMISMKEMI